MLLALSIIALIIGPLTIGLIKYNRKLDNFLFAFVLVAVGGILVFDVLPTLWQHIGLMLVPAFLLGFFGPGLIEISFSKAADKAHGLAMILGITGLVLHTMLDGAALVSFNSNQMLPYAVILHRIIVGLSIWWIVMPSWGRYKAIVVFAVMIISTLIGYYIGENQLLSMHSVVIDYFQAFISGTLLHVIIHRPHVDDHGHVHKHHHNDGHQHDKHGFVIKYKSFFFAGIITGALLFTLLHQTH